MNKILYPLTSPVTEGYLKVSSLHEIWYAEYGNSRGIPALFLHGGPGAGYGNNDMRYFDPEIYRIILSDQRGANRSRPFGEMRENTTQDLIDDIEKLRQYLGINKWLIFGGSWGSTLALAYAEAHPTRCLGFILRGVFTGTRREGDQLWNGMRDAFPDAWEEMERFLPEEERADLIGSYHKRILNPDMNIAFPAASSFMKYDITCSFLEVNPAILQEDLIDEKLIMGVAKTFSFYHRNSFFLEDNQLLNNLSKITHLPCIIVQGRYDVICRARVAYEVHKNWPRSEMIFTKAGHAATETETTKALVEATRKILTLI